MEIYKDKNASIEDRVNDLMSKMTLEEKFAQMFLTADTDYIDSVVKNGDFPKNSIGGMWGETLSAEDVNKLQDMAKSTRLGIPLIIAYESLHGLMKDYSTVFPQSIGIGATFNEELVEKMATVIGHEAYVSGIRQTFAPDLDIARDPRWGRVEETYGEDPYLTSRLGVAYVKGLQSQKVSATLKHYIAHGTPEGGLNLSPVHMGEREMREIAVEPFEICCREGKALSVMPAYSELDGIPVHASRFLLTDLLRDEIGFDGFTISDYGATGMMNFMHHVARDGVEAGRLSLNAGLDMEAPVKYAYCDEFLDSIRYDEKYLELLDKAVRRILTVKFKLGLFEDAYAKTDSLNDIRCKASLELSKKVADETLVLLKNDSSTLPISNDKKVLLVGPCADISQTGDYSPNNAVEYTVTVKRAFAEKLGDKLKYIKGTYIAEVIADELEEIEKASKDCDVIVAVVGDNSCFFGGIGWGKENGDTAITSGEGFDMSSIELPDAQKQLIKALKKTGKPVVLVLTSGRPYAITEELELVDSVIAAWYPGELGGYAICDAIYGDTVPCGKLPISFPRSTGHIPCYYNYKVSARGYYNKHGSVKSPGRDYVFDSPEALFPFGYGLSYTRFEYSDLTAVRSDNGINVSFKVKNIGNVKAKETSLVFVSQEFCSTTPFVKRLRRFAKKEYEPGEERELTFTLNDDDISYIDLNMKKAVGSGVFKITVDKLECEVTI
ncbi:MAG: glycoside hydrolase family 3 C-terminal domain-containing protein [Clostridia bacterium]|nr:glycoside hydrolase family 3 C-terminal domain-containing protein [Clostridia bacterium]